MWSWVLFLWVCGLWNLAVLGLIVTLLKGCSGVSAIPPYPNMLNVQNRQMEYFALKVLPVVNVVLDYNTRLVTCIVHLTR